MSALLGMLAVTLVASILSAGVQAHTAYENMASQERINAENVKAQQDINTQNVQAQAAINQQNIDYSREFAQNQIQWKMADLEAAGLNPTLAASGFGGSGASPSALSIARQVAPHQNAPQLDFSGVSSAITAMSNMMMTSYLMDQRNNNYSDRTDALFKKYLDSGVYRKANASSTLVNQAKQLSTLRNSKNWSKEWDQILKDLDKKF